MEAAELMERSAFIRRYAARVTGRSARDVLLYRRAIPARLDHPYPCDYGSECEGWHMVPVGAYDQGDVDSGYIAAELLEWLKLDKP